MRGRGVLVVVTILLSLAPGGFIGLLIIGAVRAARARRWRLMHVSPAWLRRHRESEEE